MLFGGFQKLSLIDYPGVISSVVFTAGCNFRCPYCQNPELVDFPLVAPISEDDIMKHLGSSKNIIDGVVITGGEPTIHRGLHEFLEKLKKSGFMVKLDTNGSNPASLESILSSGLADYVAMDLKSPPEKHAVVTGSGVEFSRIIESIRLIRRSGVNYEFRTTVFPGVLDFTDYEAIASLLDPGENYYLQDIRYVKTLSGLADPGCRDSASSVSSHLKSRFPNISHCVFHRS